jgi:hypothetical protein
MAVPTHLVDRAEYALRSATREATRARVASLHARTSVGDAHRLRVRSRIRRERAALVASVLNDLRALDRDDGARVPS